MQPPSAPPARPSRSRRALLALGTLALAGLGAARFAPAGAPRPAGLPGLPRPLVFAHRGGAGEAPEATLAAFVGAAARDPEVVLELDVRASRDGRIVVIHDESVERTTNGRCRVADL